MFEVITILVLARPTTTRGSIVDYHVTHWTHRFLVLVYGKRHNGLVLANQASYLNPYSSHSKTMKEAGLRGKPAYHAYVCRRPSAKLVQKHILKRPGASILKTPAQQSTMRPAASYNRNQKSRTIAKTKDIVS